MNNEVFRLAVQVVWEIFSNRFIFILISFLIYLMCKLFDQFLLLLLFTLMCHILLQNQSKSSLGESVEFLGGFSLSLKYWEVNEERKS